MCININVEHLMAREIACHETLQSSPLEIIFEKYRSFHHANEERKYRVYDKKYNFIISKIYKYF